MLVCCTGGEAGDILNPAMDRPEVRENLHAVRMEELRRATEIIGYDEVVMLGYRDSGMPDSPENDDPRCFARADFDEAVGRLVEIIRRERPHVIVTYADDQEGYPHPDHLQVHAISIPAFDAAADPDAFPGRGEPWQPLKLYYAAWSRARDASPCTRSSSSWGSSRRSSAGSSAPTATTASPRGSTSAGYDHVRREALLAHATQIDPESPFWFGLPPETSPRPLPLRGLHPRPLARRQHRPRGRPVRRRPRPGAALRGRVVYDP